MKNKSYRDKLKREDFCNYEFVRLCNKAVKRGADMRLKKIVNIHIRRTNRYGGHYIPPLPRVSSSSRCIVTNKAQSILNSHHLSRFAFRQMARYGQLVGIRKSNV